jgi:hypothetical protein
MPVCAQSCVSREFIDAFAVGGIAVSAQQAHLCCCSLMQRNCLLSHPVRERNGLEELKTSRVALD